MIRTRKLKLVEIKKHSGAFMKVAFASTDKVHINEHFGRAEEFYIWDIGPENAEFNGIIQVKNEGNDEADRIEARCSGLAECAVVYVAEIGGPAAARLVAKKIHPIKSKDQAPITEAVDKLQEVLRNSPPPWLKKALLKNESSEQVQ
jgi:nitrogen fixation protein NifX